MTPYFAVYYNTSSAIARFDTRIVYDSIDEMSEEIKNDIIAAQEGETCCLTYTYRSTFDYSILFGDLIAADDPFTQFKKMFGDVGDVALNDIDNKLRIARDIGIEYMSHQNFTKDFFDIFTNSKRIRLNQRLCEIINNRYFPLRIDSDRNNIYYCYESSEMTDIFFSTIHFALENGYKFAKCPHCDREFLKNGGRSGSNKKYCGRKSPFVGYEHLECEKAVRNITQEIQREKKRVYNSIVREHQSTEQIVYDFLDECAAYMSKVKENASVQNLSEYWHYLLSYRGRANYGNDK